jgi:hypothetical protein
MSPGKCRVTKRAWGRARRMGTAPTRSSSWHHGGPTSVRCDHSRPMVIGGVLRLALGRPPRTEKPLVPASVGHVSPRRRTHLVVAVGR